TEGPVEAKIITYGGIVVSLKVPDKSGKSDDVVLGFDSLDDYVKISNAPAGNPFFGAIIGRYANRIAKGKFTLDGSSTRCPSITRQILCMAARTDSTMRCGKPRRFQTESSLPT